MTHVYSVWNAVTNEEPSYFTTLAAAKKEAQEQANWHNEEAAVNRHIVGNLPRRELFCALLSGIGWCEHQEVACTVQPKAEAA